jgi:hypothetical protein
MKEKKTHNYFFSSEMSMKGEVLSLYRRIFRTARQWKAISANDQDSSQEQSFIKKEARYLFHKNKNVITTTLYY